jgi:hypothetical protein
MAHIKIEREGGNIKIEREGGNIKIEREGGNIKIEDHEATLLGLQLRAQSNDKIYAEAMALLKDMIPNKETLLNAYRLIDAMATHDPIVLINEFRDPK